MASSRASSPMSESGATSPLQLTPNSKVKAMMAAFDNDSEEDNASGSARERLMKSFLKTLPAKTSHSTASKPSEQVEQNVTKGTVESDSEDEDIVRPKGRMAAMMQAGGNSSDDEGEPIIGNARARVKKMLMAKSKSPTPTTNSEEPHVSSESDTPVVSRKRKLRVAREDTPKSSPARRSASPGLFVSPSKSVTSNVDVAGSDSDRDLPDTGNARFQALVAKKREERMAKDAEAAKERAKKAEERKKFAAAVEEDDLDDSEGDRRLTQSSRPSRKASKKALEEMHRETQRLSRNQQLAHNAITKKKITKASLFAKFNFRNPKEETPEPVRPMSSSSAAPHSDLDNKDTPPTSPASPALKDVKNNSTVNIPEPEDAIDNEDDLPTLEEALTIPSSPPIRQDKGKGKAVEEVIQQTEDTKKPLFTQKSVRVKAPKVSTFDESDSDLEIVSVNKISRKKQKLDAIFDRLPAKLAKESHSIHTLRMLAHVTSPGKETLGRNMGRNKKSSMTTSELQMSLQQRARQQATREREERLQALRDKGVIIQTSEEREKEAAEIDDIVARARLEGEQIAKREKEAAKRERKANGEVDPLGDDSSDDEDYKEPQEIAEEEGFGSGSEEENEGEVESGDGSGDESDEVEVDDLEPKAAAAANSMFDNEAAESDEEEGEDEADLSINEELNDDAEDEEDELPSRPTVRRSRNVNIVVDDEDEDEQQPNEKTPVLPQTDSPSHLSTKSPLAPNSVLRSATKTFIPGLTVAGPAGLGLTQIFAGTMDDSQAFDASATAADSENPEAQSNQDNLGFLRRLRAPDLPPFVPTLEEDTQDADLIMQSQLSHIPESQPVEMETETQGDESQMQLHISQSQVREFDSMINDTQMSQIQATQDVGYQHMTPIKGRFVDGPPSTVDTVLLESTAVPETMDETPIVKKRGKLRQKAQLATFSDDEDAVEPVEKAIEEDEFEITASVFDVMRKATKKTEKKVIVDEFDKKKSKAKEMVNEQADESEDEYAGLGGASDDESDGEEDAYVKEMIDDEGGKHVDESKLAAFFADRERASDEKQVEKLYKDITSGMLRRKRGADYDLSDSDDGGEAKQRRKRKEFAKMRKALLADERIGKIAENPKRQAFLRAIEDRGSEDEMDFLNDFAEQEEGTDSQSQSQGEGSQVVPDSQPTSMGPPKRKLTDDTADSQDRLPPHLRRTKPAKKPSNLSEIRESLSSLIEEPNAMLAAADSDSESDEELEVEGDDDLSGPRKEKNKENRDPFALRRTHDSIVDRISLKRASSSSVSNSAKLAFAVSSATQGFKVPALLRRATTNNSIASSTSSVSGGMMSGTERMAGGAGEGVKRGGGRNSGINFAARESERRAAVVKTDKRRQEKMVGRAEKRRKVVGGLFGGGKFE